MLLLTLHKLRSVPFIVSLNMVALIGYAGGCRVSMRCRYLAREHDKVDALYYTVSTARKDIAGLSNELSNMIPLFKKHTKARAIHIFLFTYKTSPFRRHEGGKKNVFPPLMNLI
jgi:hypothetical protein